MPLNEPRAAESLAWQQAGLLDVGEADALALARQLNADWFLTDDERARLPGKQLGLEVHGSLGVVLWMAAVRLIERKEAEEAIERLANSSLWVSAAVLNVMPGDSRCGMASDRIRRLTMQCKPAEPVLSEAEGRVSRLCSRSFQRMTFARAKMKHRCLKKHSLDYP